MSNNIVNKSISELSDATYIADTNLFLVSQKQSSDDYISKSISYEDLKHSLTSDLPLSTYDQFVTKDQIVLDLDSVDSQDILEKQYVLSYNGIVELNKKITAKLQAVCSKINNLTLSVQANQINIADNLNNIHTNRNIIDKNTSMLNTISSWILSGTNDNDNQLVNIEWANKEILKIINNYRGTFDTIESIPSDASLYEKDLNGNTIPHKYDYIIIKTAPEKLALGKWMYIYTEDDWNIKNTNGWQPLYEIEAKQDALNIVKFKSLTQSGSQIGVLHIDDNPYPIYNGSTETFPRYDNFEVVQEFIPEYYPSDILRRYFSDRLSRLKINFVFIGSSTGGEYISKSPVSDVLTRSYVTSSSGWYKLEIINQWQDDDDYALYGSNPNYCMFVSPLYSIEINGITILENINPTYLNIRKGVYARGGPIISTQLFYCPANATITYGINQKVLAKYKNYFIANTPGGYNYNVDMGLNEHFPLVANFKYTLTLIN